MKGNELLFKFFQFSCILIIAVLHLYYARFFSHFLHSIGLIKHREPFQRLLCQGMVKGPTYKTNDGKYLKPNDILIEGISFNSL